jgi:hypothetical protein
MNGLWVVLPVLLLWESSAEVSRVSVLAEKTLSKKTDKPVDAWMLPAPGMFWYYLSAGLIVLYAILVPAILSSAEPVPPVM